MAKLICNLLHFPTLFHVLHLYVRRILKEPPPPPNIIKIVFTLYITSPVKKLKVAEQSQSNTISFDIVARKI